MRKHLLTLAAILSLAVSSFAQTTSVTGTVKDANGVAYAGASIKAQLVLAGAAVNGQPTVTVTGVQACRSSGFGSSPCQVPFQGTTGPFTLDATGSFSQSLQDNALVTPAGTQWLFSVTISPGIPPPGGTGPQSCSATVTITGASQSVSSSLSSCPALAAAGAGGITSVSSLPATCTAGITVVQFNFSPFTILRCVAPLDGGANYFVPLGFPNNVIDPTAYGVRADSHITAVPTLTNTSNIITAADASFTGTDYLGRPIAVVGEQIFCTNATNDTSQQSSIIILAQTTILSIDSATQIHTVGSATATTAASGFCAWGHRDTAPAASVQSTSNDPMFAAWTAAANNCLPLIQPAGNLWLEQPEWNTFSAAGPCGNGNVVTNMRRGFSVQGQGPNETIDIIAPSLDPTKCTGPNATSIGCFLSAPNMYLKGFQMTGLGNSTPGAGFNGKSLVFMSGFSPGTNFQIDSVYFFGFGAQGGAPSASPIIGLNIGNGVANAVSGGTITNSIIEAFGSLTTSINSNGVFDLVNFWSVVGRTTLSSNGQLSSTNGLYGFTYGTVPGVGQDGDGATITGGQFYSTNDNFQYSTTVTAGAAEVNCQGATTVCSLTNDFILNGAAGNSGVFVENGATLILHGTTITAPFAIFMAPVLNCTGNPCKIKDDGTNAITGTTTAYTDAAGTTVTGYGATIAGNPYGTRTNCSSSASPAVCGSAIVGSFVIAAGATTVTVNTTAVTANSMITVVEDDSLGTKLGVTCNTATSVPEPNITARVNATSFSVLVTVAPVTNPKCYGYLITN